MSKPKTIHYQHPKMGKDYHACGLGDRLTIQITADINEVTCKRCLDTATGRKNSNRQIADRPKVQKQIRIDADIADSLKAQSERSGISQINIIESALTQYLG